MHVSNEREKAISRKVSQGRLMEIVQEQLPQQPKAQLLPAADRTRKRGGKRAYSRLGFCFTK